MRRSVKKKTASAFRHAVLGAGAILFAAPFLWLLSTSAKTPREMYPPAWVPGIPRGVAESPYMALRDNEAPVKPPKVDAADWRRLYGPIREAITARLLAMAADLPDFYGPRLDNRDLAEGLFARILKRTPDAVFEKGAAAAGRAFTKAITPELVREVFDVVYRRVAVADVEFFGQDALDVEQPNADGRYAWRITAGDARLITREKGLKRAAQEVHYRFGETGAFEVETVLPVSIPPDELRKTVVSIHGDQSWHQVWPVIEVNGRRYEGAQQAFLGTDRWQDVTWKFPGEDDETMRMKTWLILEDAGPSAFDAPGRIRIRLRVQYSMHLLAVLNKYINNYRDALRMVPLGVYTRNSIILVLLNIAGQVLGSSLAAFAFSRLRWPGRDFFFVVVLATLMIPPQVTMIPVFLIFRHLGWYNTLKPLWVPAFFGSAFYIFLLRQFMKGIPRDLEDSARIDGCGYAGIYWRIILPLVRPALATVGIFTFMTIWNEFMGPLIYLNSQDLYPLSLGLFALQITQGGNNGLMMAASVMMTFPVVLLFFTAQRYFIQGITLTGLKG
jgi:multiple sugar transport system permease protein